jgi:hypothetical protein
MLLSEGRCVCAVNRTILSQVEGREHRKSGLRPLIFLTDVGIESNRNLLPELALVRFTHDSGCHGGGRAGKCQLSILRMKGSGVGYSRKRIVRVWVVGLPPRAALVKATSALPG